MFYSLLWSGSIWFVHKLLRPFRLRWHQPHRHRVFWPELIFDTIDGLSECESARKTHLQFNMPLSNILPFAFCPHSQPVLFAKCTKNLLKRPSIERDRVPMKRLNAFYYSLMEKLLAKSEREKKFGFNTIYWYISFSSTRKRCAGRKGCTSVHVRSATPRFSREK